MRIAVAGLCLLYAALAACATSGPRCTESVSDCVARCESATGTSRTPARDQLGPEQTMTECEKRCGCRPGSGGGSQQKLKPTPTGL